MDECPHCGEPQELWEYVEDEDWEGDDLDIEIRCGACMQVYRVSAARYGDTIIDVALHSA